MMVGLENASVSYLHVKKTVSYITQSLMGGPKLLPQGSLCQYHCSSFWLFARFSRGEGKMGDGEAS